MSIRASSSSRLPPFIQPVLARFTGASAAALPRIRARASVKESELARFREAERSVLTAVQLYQRGGLTARALVGKLLDGVREMHALGREGST